ncbi:uncharacterized protein LOC116930729 [Daphnia magna]|uniref:uncharacterized protein LOC116930729 n=1 Tax=Daphnia magna TaxID=35525 RepID=UPI001E1BBE13|nr:uncharacterized protein LOC116930729 [Daphnia magna]XP_045035090.1 uncharacterized protein LOC116930729 [Daphnia magna]
MAGRDRQYETPEDVFQEILCWIQNENTEPKLVENAISHIDSEVRCALKSLEETCVELQYVNALLTMWARNSLEKAFIHLENETSDISTDMSTVLDELHSVDSFEDINTKLIAENSQLWTWFGKSCRYFKLILQQEELFRNTPRFALLLNRNFNKLKSYFINKIFFRYRNDILNDVDGEALQKFLSVLTEFLTKANEDKELQNILEAHILESNINTNSRETDWQGWINILVEKILKTLPPAKSDNETSAVPEWIQRFKLTVSLINKWTPKLNLLIGETYKKLLLPETTIEVREEYGRKIIFINGAAIFVSKITKKMKELKDNNLDVQEIQIVGQSSIHIDCDLENETWHGTNVGIVTHKLIVCASENVKKIVWDVSGRHASDATHANAGESGGNVFIKCNQIIGAEQWAIVSDGGDGSSAVKWSVEEFQKVFIHKCSLDEDENTEKEDEQEASHPARSNVLVKNGVIKFSYESRKKNRHTLILCKGNRCGQGGYGGNILLELSNNEHGVPPAGMEVYQAMGTGGVVYKASVSDGKTGRTYGDVGYIHNGDKTQEGIFFGFERDQILGIQYWTKKTLQRDKVVSYVKIRPSDGVEKDDLFGNLCYATIILSLEQNDSLQLFSASKKNGVIRQSLIRHFSKISERKQITDSLQKTFSSDTCEQNQSQNVDQLMKEIQNDKFQFGDLLHQQLNQERISCIKPAPSVKSSAACDPSASQGNSMSDRKLTSFNIRNRKMLASFLYENSKKFISPTWKQMSNEMKSKSKSKIENFNERIIFILSYLNDQRNLGEKEDITRKWKKKIKINGNEESGLKSLAIFLYDFECAVQQLRKPKDDNFRLRDTQILAIVTLLPNLKLTKSDRRLAQVFTGEGKSLIVAAVAIALVYNWFDPNKARKHLSEEQLFDAQKSPQRIDVITSNNLLAIRDSNLSVAEGGLRDLYDYFGVSVANNCNQSEDGRTAAYAAKVVYGQLANFQRDYLLAKFYDRNIFNNLQSSYAIVDEVDCMLLDQGSNTLYLSHDIPGMETLESLYVFIWEKLRNSTVDKSSSKEQVKDSIKSDVLFDLFGVTTKDELKLVHALWDDSEKDALWKYLIEIKVIDSKGYLLIADANEITESKINLNPELILQGKNLKAKLVFYFRKVANRQRRIRIPSHLLAFVDRNLDTWLNSAFLALDLRRDEDYVIDQDRTDTSPDLNPQVIIVDPDTGTDQTLSQWDGALHQFLQLKEGCKLTLQSLKSVFISNATYISKYWGLLGVSGTLGSEQEQIFLQNAYECDLYPIPRAFDTCFEKKKTQVLSTEEEWLNAIIRETKTTIETIPKRSIIIFCKSIKVVNFIHQRLKSSNPELSVNHRLHRYTRDYEKFAYESIELDIGHVIVATNLAGRGTDLKISKQLCDNGGLHVCLTFFPDNERIEEQIMGRAARNGAPGSGILIICKSISRDRNTPDENDTQDLATISAMEEARNFQEKQRIARLEEYSKGRRDQVKLFDDFSEYYTTLRKQLCEKKYRDWEVSAICGSVLDQWALWLDEMDASISNGNLLHPFRMEMDASISGNHDSPFDVKKYSYSTKLIPKFKIPEHNFPESSQSQLDWMTPARLVVVAKHLAATGNKKSNKFKAATSLLEQLIKSKDNQFYPAAYYYRAFILLKEDFETNQNEFIKTLRTCENVLNEQINMQISNFSIIRETDRKTDHADSFCAVDGYTQQKDNILNLFQYFLGSVRSLLGTDCSIEDFEAAGCLPKEVKGFFAKNLDNFEKWIERENHENSKVFQKKDEKKKDSKNFTIPNEKVVEYFDLLMEGESKCIGHQLNSASTIPSWNSSVEQIAESNWKTAIFQIANAYGFCASTLEKALKQAVKEELSTEDIEKEFENELKKKFQEDNLIPCTRESFWAKLIETGALFDNENFVVMDDCNVDSFNLDRDEAKELDFGDNYVLYDPIDNSKNGEEKKIIFSQEYVKDKLYGNREYNRSGDQFQFNKIAKIDIAKLKSVDLKLFGQLKDDDLRKADISKVERKEIMDELKNQKIIDDAGNLSSDYDGQSFKYPNCPAYEDTVMRLVGTKLRAEIVRRHWLKSKYNTNRLEAINLLPLTPYRDMLDDLIAAYVISGVRLKKMDEHILERKVNEITNEGHEHKCILDFLKSRQAIYEATSLKKQETALDFIDSDIRKVKANTVERELCLFRLMGFDHVMYMKDRQMSRKQMVLTSLFVPFIIIGGAVSISAGAVFTISKIWPFRVAKDLLFMGGLSDIVYVLTSTLSNHQISLSGYVHQRIRSAAGKMNLVDEGKTLWKLLESSKSGSQSYRPAVRLHMDAFHQRRLRDRNGEMAQHKIVSALLGLEIISTKTMEEVENSVH